MSSSVHFLLFALVPNVVGLKVLQFVPGFSTSHVLFNYRMAKMLTELGHNVSLWNQLDEQVHLKLTPPTGVRELRFQLDLEGNMGSLMQGLAFHQPTMADLQNLMTTYHTRWLKGCQMQLDADQEIDKFKAEQFDVVLAHAFDFCPLALAHLMGAKSVIWLASANFIMEHVADVLSLPHNPAFTPYTMSPYSDHMSFFERVANTGLVVLPNIFVLLGALNIFEDESAYFTQAPNNDFPTIWQLANQIPTQFINGEQFLDFPRPLPFGTVYVGQVGGNEEKQKETLDAKFSKIVDSSAKGTILFSLGTIANTSTMPQNMKMAFVEAFGNLKDYSIIWRVRTEDDVPEVADHPHIHLVRWLPQRLLLEHPRSQLFITHAGYNSLLEATEAAVPVLVMPLFADQEGNAMRAVRHGIGLKIDKLSVSTAALEDVIQKLLTNPKYKANSKKMLNVMNDKIVDQKVYLNYCLKFVTESKDWFPSLEAAKRLNFIQYFCLDVIFVAFISCTIALIFTGKFVLYAIRIAMKHLRSS